ncbi:MAG: HEAT repeat domain-containing protein, partial [Bdellovibrionota bacterium]
MKTITWFHLKLFLAPFFVIVLAFKSFAAQADSCRLIFEKLSSAMEFESIYSNDAKTRKQAAYRTLDFLISDESDRFESAFQRVKNWDSRAVPAFLEIFLDSNESLERREQAATVLKIMAQPKALSEMIEALKWPEPRLRARAAGVLGSIGSPEAREALLEAARDKEPSVKQAAELALSNLLTKKRQKFLMAKLGERFNYNKPEDWYQLSKREVQSVVGSGILNQYNGSVAEMVMALVEAPEGGWVPWKFSQVSKGFWDDEANQKAYMKWLGEK